MEIINLNLIPGKAWPVAHATQFDKGREFRANLFEGSQVYTLAGDETVDAIIKKPDGNQVIKTLTNTADNYVIVTTTEQMTAVAGPSLGEIRLSKGDKVIGSLKFILECEQSADTGIESHSEINNLEAQVAAIVADQYDADNVVFDAAPTAGHGVGFAVTSEGVLNAIPDELNDLSDVTITSPSNGEILVFDGAEWVNQANPASTTNFGAPYDENTTYNVPSLVIYNNLLYKLNDGEDGTTGPWDPTKWTQTSVAELAQLIGSLSTLTTTDKSSIVGAVNEVVSTKANKSGMFKIQTFTTTYSVAGNGSVSFDNSFITVPTGYVLGAVLEFTSGQGQVALVSVRPNNGSQWAFELVNTSSVARNNQTFTIRILFIKSDLIS